jgi:hypothetical protein
VKAKFIKRVDFSANGFAFDSIAKHVETIGSTDQKSFMLYDKRRLDEN